MNKKELKKSNGDVYFEATRMPDNSYILLNWIGMQSLESIMMGANHVLSMLRQQPCINIINSNQELIGPWEDGANFMGIRWARDAKNLGLKNFAHVWAPGIFGRRSFKKFEENASTHLQVETFESVEEASDWLKN